MLLFDVNGQTLKRTDHFTPASDSQEYLKAQFTFKSSEWSGKTKTALFRLGTAVYKSVLNSNGVCTVPSEVLVGGESRLARLNGSTIQVSVIGEYSTVRIPTNEVDIKIPRSGYASAETPAEPTESEYTQMVTVAADAVAEAEEARTACENARADLVGVKNIFANAVKGNLSGAVVFADDVSPVEHNPIVKARSKNLLNMADFSPTNDGTSFTFENNVLTVTGYFISAVLQHLTIGKTYTLSFTSRRTGDTGGGVSIELRSVDGSRLKSYYHTSELSKTVTFTIPEGTQRVGVYFYGSNSTNGTTSATYEELMLEEGETKTAYVPYFAPSEISVKRCGKNLLTYPYSDGSISVSGITVEVKSNGTLGLSGTATNTQNFYFEDSEKLFLPKGTYTVSVGGSFSCSGEIRLWLYKTSTSEQVAYISFPRDTQQTFTLTEGTSFNAYLMIMGGSAISGTMSVQIEVGNSATVFEPYSGAEYIAASDGTVSDIVSLSPNMTVLTDTAGAIVDCEYTRDTNKVIERLVNAVVALGGSV